jgi:hypothetical protein
MIKLIIEAVTEDDYGNAIRVEVSHDGDSGHDLGVMMKCALKAVDAHIVRSKEFIDGFNSPE